MRYACITSFAITTVLPWTIASLISAKSKINLSSCVSHRQQMCSTCSNKVTCRCAELSTLMTSALSYPINAALINLKSSTSSLGFCLSSRMSELVKMHLLAGVKLSCLRSEPKSSACRRSTLSSTVFQQVIQSNCPLFFSFKASAGVAMMTLDFILFWDWSESFSFSQTSARSEESKLTMSTSSLQKVIISCNVSASSQHLRKEWQSTRV